MEKWTLRSHWINVGYDDAVRDFRMVFGEEPDEDEAWTIRLVATNEFDLANTHLFERLQ